MTLARKKLIVRIPVIFGIVLIGVLLFTEFQTKMDKLVVVTAAEVSAAATGAAYSCGFADGMEYTLDKIANTHWEPKQQTCLKYRDAAHSMGFKY